MSAVTPKQEIKNAFDNVRKFSFQTKKEAAMDEEKVNAFLDAINDLKSLLNKRNKKLSHVNEQFEKITWLNNLNKQDLMLLNDLIATSKDLHSSLIRQYVQLNLFRQKGIAKKEIHDFKSEIDDLRESFEDLESIFFYLPKQPDFKETTKLLSLV